MQEVSTITVTLNLLLQEPGPDERMGLVIESMERTMNQSPIIRNGQASPRAYVLSVFPQVVESIVTEGLSYARSPIIAALAREGMRHVDWNMLANSIISRKVGWERYSDEVRRNDFIDEDPP